MKKSVILLLLFSTFFACKKEVLKKPNNLVEKETMLHIMYDLMILDAVKYHRPMILDSLKTTPAAYIYKKYKVDSLQFAQSNKYYASDYKEYKNMYEAVATRIKQKKIKLEEKAKPKILKISKAKPSV